MFRFWTTSPGDNFPHPVHRRMRVLQKRKNSSSRTFSCCFCKRRMLCVLTLKITIWGEHNHSWYMRPSFPGEREHVTNITESNSHVCSPSRVSEPLYSIVHSWDILSIVEEMQISGGVRERHQCHVCSLKRKVILQLDEKRSKKRSGVHRDKIMCSEEDVEAS